MIVVFFEFLACNQHFSSAPSNALISRFLAGFLLQGGFKDGVRASFALCIIRQRIVQLLEKVIKYLVTFC